MLKNFLSFLAIFTLSCAAHPFTLILLNKMSQGEEANVESHKETMLPSFSTDFLNDKTVWNG